MVVLLEWDTVLVYLQVFADRWYRLVNNLSSLVYSTYVGDIGIVMRNQVGYTIIR